MNSFEDRKTIRRDHLKHKKVRPGLVTSDKEESKQKVKTFKQMKQSYSNDEEWEEWQEYYK
jgi:hypothetical protein